MAAKKTSKTAEKAMEIRPITTDTVEFYIRGVTPIILHRMSDKAKEAE